jgi:hypothetical protein
MEIIRAGITINKKDFTKSFFLFFYLLAFYGIITILIPDLFFPAEIQLHVKIAVNLIICVFILLNDFIAKRINKLALTFMPVLLICLSFTFYFMTTIVQIIAIIIMAIAFSCQIIQPFVFFRNTTTLLERGRIAGMLSLLILPIIFFLELIPLNSVNDLYFPLITLLLNVGYLLIITKGSQVTGQAVNLQNSLSGEKFFEKRVILLYLIPWIMFSIINVTLAQNISLAVISNMPEIIHISLIGLQTIGVCFGTILAGIITDFYGRRVALIASLTLYGISVVIQGIFNFGALSIGYFLNGTSWGLLFVMYFFVIFSDLSNKSNALKMFALGLFPYFIATTIGQIYQFILPDIPVSSLLTCLIIFLAIIPIFFAPELMSQDFIYNLKIKRHLKEIKKHSKN